jgi:hypothetical protein
VKLHWEVKVKPQGSAQSALVVHRLVITDSHARRGAWADVDDIAQLNGWSAELIDEHELIVHDHDGTMLSIAVDSDASGTFTVWEG